MTAATVPWLANPVTSTPWLLVHIARAEDTTGEKDPHGNWPVIEEPPVVRKFYNLSQFGRRGSSHIVQGPEFQERTTTLLHISVPDPSTYVSGDQIILFAVIDEDDQGNYSWEAETPDGQPNGTAYWVDGDPSEERMSPWPYLTMQFGGIVKVQRVT